MHLYQPLFVLLLYILQNYKIPSMYNYSSTSRNVELRVKKFLSVCIYSRNQTLQRYTNYGRSNFYNLAAVAMETNTEHFYVADGYESSDSTITIIPFHIVHKLAVTLRHTLKLLEKVCTYNQGVIVAVADRNNYRIQCFSGTISINGNDMYAVSPDSNLLISEYIHSK